MARRRIRDTDPQVRFRNMEEIAGLPGVAGLSRVGDVAGGRGGGVSVLSGQGGTIREEADPFGQLLVLTATSDSIASGGDTIGFSTTPVVQVGFDGTLLFSGAWSHPFDGVYHLDLDFAWDSYTEGGLVELELDGTVATGGTIAASGEDGEAFTASIAYKAQEGQVGRIKVTQSSGSAQTCDARVMVSVTAPYRLVDEAMEAPASVDSVGYGDTEGGNVTLTLDTADLTVVAGDTMFVSWSGYSLDGAQGDDGTMAEDNAWTVVAEGTTYSTSGDRNRVEVLKKVAEAADEAGTATYDFVVTCDPSYTSLLCSVIPQGNGATFTDPETHFDRFGPLNTDTPSGDWVLAIVVGKLRLSGGTGTLNPIVTTSDADLLATRNVAGLRGIHRHYAIPATAVGIDATLGDAEYRTGALVCVGVTR